MTPGDPKNLQNTSKKIFPEPIFIWSRSNCSSSKSAQNLHKNKSFSISPPHPQPPGVVHPSVTKGDPSRAQQQPKIPFTKWCVSWAYLQVIRIQLHIIQTNFLASAHPILNIWRWVTHPWQKKTPPLPKNNPKYLPKDLFPEPIFKLLRSSCTPSKSAHKKIVQPLPTPSSTGGGGSLTCDPRGSHQNLKTTQNTSKKQLARSFYAASGEVAM